MPLAEFDIIARYFDQPGLAPARRHGAAIPLGIGDDAALLALAPGDHLALTMDLLVADVHFPAAGDPFLIAQKALAVNLSDLAAMGASPVGFTLGLTLPRAEEKWLEGFSAGLRELAAAHDCPLIGGDITHGPLCIVIQAHGRVEAGRALRRDGARAGDRVYVSGTVGDGGAGLDYVTGKLAQRELTELQKRFLEAAYYQPEPRLDLGRQLSGVASAAIDVSDGLLADLGHIAARSGVGIRLRREAVPLSAVTQEVMGRERAAELALTAGDDYELAFTVPPQHVTALDAVVRAGELPCTWIGEVVEGGDVLCLDEEGRAVSLERAGYSHF